MDGLSKITFIRHINLLFILKNYKNMKIKKIKKETVHKFDELSWI